MSDGLLRRAGTKVPAAPTGLVPSGGWHRPSSRPGIGSVSDGPLATTPCRSSPTTASTTSSSASSRPCCATWPRTSPPSTSPTASARSTCAAARWPWPGPSPYVPEGVVLAVVDPGVGTARRAIAVEVAGGRRRARRPGQRAARPGRRHRRRRRAGRRADRPGVPPRRRAGATFAGRDVFAPVAAHLCNGVDLAELGPLVDTDLLMPGMVAAAPRGGRRHPRRGAVGRPLRQLPAQHRARRADGRRRRLGG